MEIYIYKWYAFMLYYIYTQFLYLQWSMYQQEIQILQGEIRQRIFYEA